MCPLLCEASLSQQLQVKTERNFILTEPPAVCSENPGSFLSVCLAAQPVEALKTKQCSKGLIHAGSKA